MTSKAYCAVYDFELMPYALGDVLTWNVQTAIRARQAGRAQVDILVCLDERHPASIYQEDLVTADNCALFFNELQGAFGTHPLPGNQLIFRRREELLAHWRLVARDDSANAEALAEYERALALRHDEDASVGFFTDYIHSHQRINAFAATHGRIPLLRPSLGCEPDVAGLQAVRFAGKRVVVVHMRLRRLDAGYGGEHTYARDSDFLEWHEFLVQAHRTHPDVEFVVVGRLQEKPLELLKLPNVTSLRTLGLGLGHELTLMLRSDLFIGTSSGFAALANFSTLPYFITRMTPASCAAYGIEANAARLPFATERQILVYEPETRELLTGLLERGLKDVPRRAPTGGPPSQDGVDVRGWEHERSRWLHPGATTFRFFVDERYTAKETAFLLWPKVREARAAWRDGMAGSAWSLLQRIEASFPQSCAEFPEFLRLKRRLAAQRNDDAAVCECERLLQPLDSNRGAAGGLKRYWGWSYPLRMRLKRAWGRRHRIPHKLRSLVWRSATARN
jgi:hypothetical protein